MPRRVLNILAVISMIGVIITTILFAASREHLHYVQRRTQNRLQVVTVRPIGIYLAAATYVRPPPSTGWQLKSEPAPGDAISSSLLGFSYGSFEGAEAIGSGESLTFTPFELTFVVVPFWFVFVLTGVLPGLAVWRYERRRRRSSLGLCRSCGYDLRASAGRCPECGQPIEATVACGNTTRAACDASTPRTHRELAPQSPAPARR